MFTAGNLQHVTPQPDVLREYGQRFLAERMDESGENFAFLSKRLSENLTAQGGGRDVLMRATLNGYGSLLQLCPELAELERRIREVLL